MAGTGSDPGTTALEYFKGAEGHYVAAKILAPHAGLVGTNFDTTTTVFLAFYNVLGFALEMYLKAFLQNAGHHSDQLSKKPFGHDLKNLLDQAVKDGLRLPDDTVKVVIQNIGRSHGEFTYRYLREGAHVGYINADMYEVVFRGLDAFDAEVRRIVVKP